uniref:Uncharacterized protein LOC111112576 n=1 Tax=Crassostrea virginica TaxID=6565 RepID=A0A8B8BS81_CRAVI|nr:uncharacterized protein LOC111112576 [Crassostrea virginica]
MDPRHSAQDVVRCALCRDAVAPLYCNVCHTHLCGDCVEKHFSDKSKVHNVVPLEQFLSTLNYPNKCPTHPTKQCELHCEQCDIPICTSCISSGIHIGHKQLEIFADFESKKEVLRRDLQELEKSIFSKYQESAAIIKTQKTDQLKHSQKLTAELHKQGEALHREINTIIQRKQAEIDEMNAQHLAAIQKQEYETNKALHEIKQVIQDLKSLLDTSDVGLVSKYRSRIAEFRKLPHKLKISLPNLLPQKINREELLKQFGSINPLSIETEEQIYTVPSPGAESSPPARPLLDVPRLITYIPTTVYGSLYYVSCLSDEEIWTRGDNKIMKLYNLKGELLKSVQTKSGNDPRDIAVTRSGGLVYADYVDRSINLVSGTQKLFSRLVSGTKIQTLITLRGWRPCYLCSTASGDLLVIMTSDNRKQTKVVRYSGSTEKQIIQYDDQGKPLYSSGGLLNIKYLSENRNLDICVADYDARAVVVVSAAGKLRFRYTGPPSTPGESFSPFGITTDSQANILTSDCDNHCIHIIDQDGHFLRSIHNCGLWYPRGLCVDSQDYLFVAELTGKVKKLHCISSGKHIGHKQLEIFADFESKKEVLRRDLQELEKSIFPKYQESAAIIKTQKADQLKHSQKLTSELNIQGEALHREIHTIIQRKQAEIDEMNAQHLAAIEKQEDETNKALHEIKQVIQDLKSLLDTSDVGLVSKYRSRIAEFRKLPHKLKISLPNFLPQKINSEELLKQIGSLSPLSIETEEQDYTVPAPGAESSPPARPLLDVPRLITELDTGYNLLYNVSCLSDEEIWTSGDNNKIMKLYNLKGKLLKSVQTKSGTAPWDIAVTRSGDLVYTDYEDISINLVRGTHIQTLFSRLVSGTQIQTLITLRGWRPRRLCSTSTGDLLVIMTSDEDKQTKVVRYSGSTEKQTIQWDDQGNLLYSSGAFKYLSENRNSDICVADFDARAVVVVSAAGKLRFRYTGPPSTPEESFRPFCITTDSQANILTSDYWEHRIHIIDQDGHFLRFLHNCGLQNPRGLCVDSQDFLFVAERDTGKVKKLQYFQ